MNPSAPQGPLSPRPLLLTLVGVCAILWFASPDWRSLLTLPLLVLTPGALLTRLFLPQHSAPISERLALWITLGCAFITLLYQWAGVLGLALLSPLPELIAIGCAIAAIVMAWNHQGPFQPGRFGATLAALMLLTCAARMDQIRTLVLPAWVDSVHHALLIRVAAETGLPPLSLRPYLPVDQLPYHWGYHAISALTMLATQAPIPAGIPTAMLLQGQLLSSLIVPVYAGLAHALWRRPIAGAVAGLIVGLISVMPGYYTSWGRYTLLLGMLMLPGAMLILYRARHNPTARLLIAPGVALAGLALTHFVVMIFALVWWGVVISQNRRTAEPQNHGSENQEPRTQNQFSNTGTQEQGNNGTKDSAHDYRPEAVTLSPCHLVTLSPIIPPFIAGVLTAPWFLLLVGRARAGSGASATYVAGNSSYNALPLDLLWTSNNRLLLALAMLGVLLGIRRRLAVSAQIAVWCFLVALLANLPWIGLPYLSFVTNETVTITLFAPVALLIGGGSALLYERIALLIPRSGESDPPAISHQPQIPWVLGLWSLVSGLRPWLLPILILGLGFWGAREWRDVFRADTLLATADDRAAIAWVAAETPPDARFLVNTTSWLGSVDRGADGGWWLLPLAGRQVSTPPVLYTYASDADVAAIQRRTAWLRNDPSNQRSDLDIATFMQAEGFTYIYAVEGAPVLDSARLRQSPLFEELYHGGRVSVLRLRE